MNKWILYSGAVIMSCISFITRDTSYSAAATMLVWIGLSVKS